jgi:hypothetical protein
MSLVAAVVSAAHRPAPADLSGATTAESPANVRLQRRITHHSSTTTLQETIMPLTSRTLTAALAALLIAAPAATARPADIIHPGLGHSAVAGNTQDLRSPDVRDAANHYQTPASSQAGTSAPAQAQPITRAPAANATDNGNGVDWMLIGLGVAGSLLTLGGLAALALRTQRLRATT